MPEVRELDKDAGNQFVGSLPPKDIGIQSLIFKESPLTTTCDLGSSGNTFCPFCYVARHTPLW